MPPALYAALRSSLLSLGQAVDAQRAEKPLPQAIPAVREALDPVELESKVRQLWEECRPYAHFDQGVTGKHVEVARSVLELVGRELIMAVPAEEPEIDASPEVRCVFQTNLQDRLDIVLTLYEVIHGSVPDAPMLEPGALLIPVFDDLVDLLSMEAWKTLWGYFETRGFRFTKDMPSSRGKALPLLKFLNSFYRYLPRTPAFLPFRARVHEWATTAFEISDKSSVNFRGDFPLTRLVWEDEEIDNEDVDMADGGVEQQASTETVSGTTVETADQADVAVKAGDGSETAVDGKEDDSTAIAAGDTSVEPTKSEPATREVFDLYSAFWSLQTFLTQPPKLTSMTKTKASPNSPERTAFETFQAQTDFVLPHLYKAPRTEDVQIVLGKRTRDEDDSTMEPPLKRGPDVGVSSSSDTTDIFPRYLPQRRLFEHQLADVAFRRQVFVQYLILIRFLLNFTPSAEKLQTQFKVHKNTGGVGGEGPKSQFNLSKEDETWLRDTLTKVRIAITNSGPGGGRLRATMAAVIRSEDHYAKWKSAGCPSDPFAKAPMPEKRATEVQNLWRRRLQPTQPWWHKLGTESLTSVWRNSIENAEQLKNWPSQPTFRSLDEKLQQINADLAAIAEDDPLKASKTARLEELQNTLNWRGLRLATHSHLNDFKFLKETRNLHDLVRRIDGLGPETNGAATEDVAAPKPVSADADGMEGVEEAEVKEEAKEEELTAEDLKVEKPEVEVKVPAEEARPEEAGSSGEGSNNLPAAEVDPEEEREITESANDDADMTTEADVPPAADERTKEESA